MGCDWYADKDGKFEIEIRDYEASETLKIVKITGLKPYNKISYDIWKGDVR